MINNLKASPKMIWRQAIPVVIVVAALGIVVALVTFAAGSLAAFEPESGTLTNGAQAIVQAGASGGTVVKFGATTTATPTPTATPTGGCPAYPAFPDANCTGWQHTGVMLKSVPSQLSSGTGWHWETGGYVAIDGTGAVLDGLDINGCVSIFANNVTIKRSRIKCGSYYVIKNFDPPTNFSGLLVEDTELDGMNSLSGSAGISFSGYTARRVNVHGISSLAFHIEDNATVEDSYVHDYVCGYADGVPANGILHQAGMGTNGGGSHMVMRHNNIDLASNLINGEGCISGGIANYHDFGTFDDMLIEKNQINSGGGYCLKAGVVQTGMPYPNSTNVRVIDNVFGRKYFAECGQFGAVSNWAAGGGNAWSGNAWGGGAAATSAHAVGDVVAP